MSRKIRVCEIISQPYKSDGMWEVHVTHVVGKYTEDAYLRFVMKSEAMDVSVGHVYELNNE